MPSLTPWQRVRPESRPNVEMPRASCATRAASPPVVRRTRLIILALLTIACSTAALLLVPERPIAIPMTVAWEVHGVQPLTVTDDAILARRKDRSAGTLPTFIDVATGSTVNMNVEASLAPLPVTGGVAWLQGGAVLFRDVAGRTTVLPGVPSGSSLLHCWRGRDGPYALVEYSAPDAGSWKVRLVDSVSVRWELSTRGVPVTASANDDFVAVGVADPGEGPRTSLYLLQRDTGRVVLEYDLGCGLFRAMKCLPGGLLVVATGARAVLLSVDGRVVCQLSAEGNILSADATADSMCVVAADPAGRRSLSAVSRDGSVRWRRLLPSECVVRCFGEEIICLQRDAILCFSSDSGEELWYYPLKDCSAWLLKSGILLAQGDVLRFFRCSEGPG